jgi:hypothetical protein
MELWLKQFILTTKKFNLFGYLLLYWTANNFYTVTVVLKYDTTNKNTHITQNITPRSNGTTHKVTQTIKDTLHAMNTTQKKNESYLCNTPWRPIDSTARNTGHTQRNGEVSKVIKNLFLTLHKQNITQQQWELSKFIMRYQQFAFMLTVGPRDQFPRWRRSRRRLSVCFVLRCKAWVSCTV